MEKVEDKKALDSTACGLAAFEKSDLSSMQEARSSSEKSRAVWIGVVVCTKTGITTPLNPMS